MLVLSRSQDESVEGTVTEAGLLELLAELRRTNSNSIRIFNVTAVDLKRSLARLGFESPPQVRIRRGELVQHTEEESCPNQQQQQP